MMEQKNQISSDISVWRDRLPPLSSKYPWLVAQSLEGEEVEDGTGDHYFYNLHDPQSHYRCQIPELAGKRIRGYFHGWLVLSNHPHNDMWSLWNPSSNSDVISLPPLVLEDKDYQSLGECYLSAPPDDPNSVLLLTRTNKPNFVFYRLSCERKKLRKKLRWIEMSYLHQLKRITWNGALVHSLTCCNGKIYALHSRSYLGSFVIQVEIVVKDKEVVIKLLLFGGCPFKPSARSGRWTCFLKGTCTELFYIIVGFHAKIQKVPSTVRLFKLDTTNINWEELESLKDWDMNGIDFKVLQRLGPEDFKDLEITRVMWEEMEDLKDAIFFVDLARDKSIFYNPTIASEIGGYIHIRDNLDKIIYSYHVNYQTIVPSSMPSPVLPTSQVSLWECWSEDDHIEPKFTVDSKHEEDEMAVTLFTDHVVEVSKSRLLDIPFDVLQMIMKFCVGVEYMNFRAACKRCHQAAPLIQWHNKIELQNYSLISPWLMVTGKYKGTITFTNPMLGDNYFMKNLHVSICDDTYCSRFGWLLFKTCPCCPVFFNPFTNDLLSLPEADARFKLVCFSAPPTSTDCMVVGFSSCNIHVHFVSGEATWKKIYLGNSHPHDVRFPTFFGPDLYALCDDGELIVFKDLGGENFSWKYVIDKPPRSCSMSSTHYLVTCDKHILLVVMGGLADPIEVLQLGEFTQEWEKINGIGKHTICICDTRCVCVDAKVPEMENKIFLPQLCSKRKKIVFYSLDTCRFHTFNGKCIQEKLGDIFTVTTHLSAHAWIEPSWSRLSPLKDNTEEIEKHCNDCSFSKR